MIDSLVNFVQYYVGSFNSYAKEYPMVGGALSLWLLGVGSWAMKDIPLRVYNLLLRQITVEVSILSSANTYFKFLEWYNYKGYSETSRTVKYSNGRWGDEDMLKSIGYGVHFIWFKRRPIRIEVAQQETAESNKERDIIKLKSIGRSHHVFDKIFMEVESKRDIRHIKKYHGEWRSIGTLTGSRLSSVCVESHIKSDLMNCIQIFLNRKEWYNDKSIPYQLGIMLYGPPGTGKTSIIRCIASELDRDLHVLNASKIRDIEDAMSSLPQDSLIVVEDIDTDSSTHSRAPVARITEDPDESPPIIEEEIFKFSLSNLSDTLNAIDGLGPTNGRILIMTTNVIDKLDRALIRPGRIDLMVELGYVTRDTFYQMMTKFYGPVDIPPGYCIKSGVTPAELQQLILKNLESPKVVLNNMALEGQSM